jgi:YD repeat-containing protein
MLSFLGSMFLASQGPVALHHFYDDAGQLTKVVDSAGNVVEYVYDPAGNIVQINRTSVAPGVLATFNFTPQRGAVGTAVTILGQNFSTTPSSNIVQFITKTGPGWAAPGPHFPDQQSLANLRRAAFARGDVFLFAAYLHSMQDVMAHSGQTPTNHFMWLWFTDEVKGTNLALQDAALVATAQALTAFWDRWGGGFCTCTK